MQGLHWVEYSAVWGWGPVVPGRPPATTGLMRNTTGLNTLLHTLYTSYTILYTALHSVSCTLDWILYCTHCTQATLHYTLHYIIHCTALYSMSCTLDLILYCTCCTLGIVHYTLSNIASEPCRVLCTCIVYTLYSIHGILKTFLCTVYTVNCTVITVHWLQWRVLSAMYLLIKGVGPAGIRSLWLQKYNTAQLNTE